MMGLIHVDYDNARRQAQRLDQAADDCGTVIQALQKELSNLPANWTGAAADACEKVLENQVQDLKVMQQETEQLAAIIRRVADAFEEKERQLRASMESAQTSLDNFSGIVPGGSGSGGGGRGGGGF